MNSGLGGITIQSLGVRVARQAIHYGKTHTTSSVDLQTQVIMGAGHWMIMLMNDKMMSISRFVTVVEVKPAGMSQARRGRRWPTIGCKLGTEEGNMVANIRYTCLDLSCGGFG